MTKHEWEKELRKNLFKLPKHEADRAVSYYDELFADKEEQGYSEREIIREFGNPFDVATSIIRDYELESSRGYEHDEPYRQPPRYNEQARYSERETAFVPPAPQQQRRQDQRDVRERVRSGGGALVRLVTLLPFIIITIVLGALFFAFVAAAIACIVGGVGGIVLAFIGYGSIAIFAAEAGAGLVVTGLGGIFLLISKPFAKSLAALTRSYFGGRK